MDNIDKGVAINVLFTSAGRRVELIDLFKREGYTTHAADCNSTAPTLRTAHKGHLVPRILEDPDIYIDALLEIVKKENIQVIIPLIDAELMVLSEARELFLEYQADIMISTLDHVAIAFDKYRTYRFFKTIGLPTPETHLVEELSRNKEYPNGYKHLFPAVLKPRYGAATEGIIICNDMDYVFFLQSRGKLADYLLQKKVEGVEVTIDILGDGHGRMIGAVQRRRLKIRAGEVERGVTVKYKSLENYILIFSRQYSPYGVINIQCFYDEERDKVNYIEINPRFGGGYPLAYYAGANFPRLIRRMLGGENLQENVCDYEEGLIMTRYDSAVYYKP